MFAFATMHIKTLGEEVQETNYAGDRGGGTLEIRWGVNRKEKRRIFTLYLSTDTYLCVYMCVYLYIYGCMCVCLCK